MHKKEKTALESAALARLDDRVGVDQDSVAAALATEILNRVTEWFDPAEAIEAGIAAAIEAIDDATFDFAVDVIRGRVVAEVEGQAKAIALRMLRETAAPAERAAAACSIDGGI